ncbi:anaphase-promoting complex subunit 11 RING-H2 finger-domain containing protein [Nitzschia inconspicua]|uniref:Anaphase-promoting complex subunit 11 RING-H2 finger-domain containing protein n=1 Tax=Nitzschia inconspicua TaxID=303405 RepID=A0A9K3KCT3_9STRA|nr:anaphase-promoting complex subunit 11 RING-H2 finger-domain containing protein [Nitzschia inconspicua]
MNLELLDPFGRQIPDRVDSTLLLPPSLHFPSNNKHNEKDSMLSKTTSAASGTTTSKELAQKAAASLLAFNRRGSYIAVAYESGTIAIFDILSRTPSSVYRFYAEESEQSLAITALSWSRRSRTLVAGRMGSPRVMLMDLTHPAGPVECSSGGVVKINDKDGEEDHHGGDRSHSPTMTTSGGGNGSGGGGFRHATGVSFAKRSKPDFHSRESRSVEIKMIPSKDVGGETATNSAADIVMFLSRRKGLTPAITSKISRYPTVTFSFPEPLGGGSSLQIHPKDPLSGYAVLQDGSIVVFQVPSQAFDCPSSKDKTDVPEIETSVSSSPPTALMCKVYESHEFTIACAAFDPHGERLYAATTNGKLLGFEVARLFEQLWSRNNVEDCSKELPALRPNFVISIPGSARVWNMVVSRNGRFLVINSADAAIRLYDTSECWTTPEEVEKPLFVFQDVVQKVKFESCDISGDGEYVAGGAQGNETKYEIYIWNTSTGVLADKLTGAPTSLSSLAWHPTRSFLAVAASDGLVDRWGPRINWTAFAPDFQALPQNVEYVEEEDEFDVLVDGGDGPPSREPNRETEDEETAHVDILTLHKIPVFQSDSEDEAEVFHFDVVKRPVGSGSS